jgi:DNA-directed RNA polymerase specialized sigma24 family protein
MVPEVGHAVGSWGLTASNFPAMMTQVKFPVPHRRAAVMTKVRPLALAPRSRHDDADQVCAAIAGLIPAQRRAIELAYFGGHTDQQLAAELSLPVGTARAQLHAGILRLRGTLGSAHV